MNKRGIHTRNELEFVPNWADELPYKSMAIRLLNSGRMPSPVCPLSLKTWAEEFTKRSGESFFSDWHLWNTVCSSTVRVFPVHCILQLSKCELDSQGPTDCYAASWPAKVANLSPDFLSSGSLALKSQYCHGESDHEELLRRVHQSARKAVVMRKCAHWNMRFLFWLFYMKLQSRHSICVLGSH